MDMKLSSVVLMVAGLLIALAGLVFALQGMGLVGPGNSFMYSNPSWITYGVGFLVVGIVMTAAALGLDRRRSDRPPT